MISLVQIPASHIDYAYRDGAACLSDACDYSGGEITGDQLKMILSKGERTLYAMVEDEKPIGWGVARIDQLPNMRVFFITDLVARGVHFERFLELVKAEAYKMGCSRVRCGAKPVQARIYQHKCGFVPVYEILEVVI